MTKRPPDPLVTPPTDPDSLAPVDEQTWRLREENRALRELLAEQARAALLARKPGPRRRLCWWLISAPGAALVGWRSLLGRDDARPITGKRVGYATLTVLYTLAIYGALVLLVVSWNSPSTPRSESTAPEPLRVPLTSPPNAGIDAQAPEANPAPAHPMDSEADAGASPQFRSSGAPSPLSAAPSAVPIMHSSEHADTPAPPALAREPAPAAPPSTLRATEIPALDPLAWLDALRGELALCAELGFFERPECAWAARRQYCEPNRAWGMVNECPSRP